MSGVNKDFVFEATAGVFTSSDGSTGVTFSFDDSNVYLEVPPVVVNKSGPVCVGKSVPKCWC